MAINASFAGRGKGKRSNGIKTNITHDAGNKLASHCPNIPRFSNVNDAM